MADDTKGKGADDAKQFEAPKTLEEAVKLAETLHSSVQKLEKAVSEANAESKERKEKLRAIEKEKQDRDAAALKEKGQFEELVKTLEPKAQRAETLEAALKGYYDLEVADVPEEKRSLIPAGPVETQLQWLKNAKTQGVFGAPKKEPEKTDHKKTGDPNAPEFLSWAPNDPRLPSLSRENYNRWKQHNGRDGSGRASGGGAAWGNLPK